MSSVDFVDLAQELLQAESHFAFEDALAILGNKNQMLAQAMLSVRPAPILVGDSTLFWEMLVSSTHAVEFSTYQRPNGMAYIVGSVLVNRP